MLLCRPNDCVRVTCVTQATLSVACSRCIDAVPERRARPLRYTPLHYPYLMWR